MRILAFLFVLSISFSKVNADEEGPVCKKCQKIREYNAEHPENNYYWYDDYLKEKKEGQPHRDQPSQNTNTSSENLKKQTK